MLPDTFVGLSNAGSNSCCVAVCKNFYKYFVIKMEHLRGHPRIFIPLNISVLHFQLLINVIPLLDGATVSGFSLSFQIILKLGQLWGCPKAKKVLRIYLWFL